MGTSEVFPAGKSALDHHSSYIPAPNSLFDGTSRLSPTLRYVLSDQDVLAYLIDFMQNKGMVHLLRFWMDCEQFYQICTAFPKSEAVNVAFPPSAEGDGPHHSFPFHAINISGRPCDFNGFSKKQLSPDTTIRFQKDLQDNAIRIYSQYISFESPEFIGVNEEMRRQIMDNMCETDSQVGIDCFRAAQDKIYEMLNDKIFPEFLQSYHFLRYKSSLVLSDRVTLADILNCHQTLESFVEFLASIDGLDLVQFILSAAQFESQWRSAEALGHYNAEWAQKDAIVVYEKYVSLQADKPISLSDRTRIAVEEGICSESGTRKDCFREAVNLIYSLVSQFCLPRFYKSESFMRYLLELDKALKKAVIVAGIIPTPRSSIQKRSSFKSFQGEGYRRSVSSSSEPHFSVSNSSTPSYNPQPFNYAASYSGSVPSSEHDARSLHHHRASSTAQILDCDSRSSHSVDMSGTISRLRKMTMGEVDALGRFISFSEPEPLPAPSEGFFRRSVRKMNGSVEVKRKNEQAALDAQRIIEDILSQTVLKSCAL